MTNLIVAYAPTAESQEQDLETFYENIQSAMTNIKKDEITMLLGDFNAKVGHGRDEDVVGEFGLGIRNERGERLIQFCKDIGFAIMNTYFKLPPRRLYTWRAPGDNEEHLIRNQIDFIMINRRFRNSLTSVKTYPGADANTDHNLLLSNMILKLKRISKRSDNNKPDIYKLKEEHTRQKIKKEINEKFRNMSSRTQHTIEDKWNNIKESISTITENNLRSNTNKKKNKWMTDEILELIDKRRTFKNKNEERYKDTNKIIRRKIKQAKEDWLDKKCSEIEELDRKHDTMNLHKKVKEGTGLIRTTQKGNLTDCSGKVIWDLDDKINKWKEYTVKLFSEDERRNHKTSYNNEFLFITKSETIKAIRKIKDNKAPGPDKIHGELLKMVEEEHLDPLTDLFNDILRTGEIPKEWLLSTFVPIPKKANAKKCEDYRLISLMSHILKIFLRIIHDRINAKIEQHMGVHQFGFRDGLGTREALFSVQVLIQRARDVDCDVYVCFLDFEKAFDKVKHSKLMNILEGIRIDSAERRIIENLYWQQRASIKVEGRFSEEIEIQRGVRQGCVLSPLLFNIYSEKLFEEAIDNLSEGISINGININNIRYADDTVLLADSAEGLQAIIDRVVTISKEYGLTLNAKKTKTMIISKTYNIDALFNIDQKRLQRVDNFIYLGCQLNESWDHSREVKIRIEKARSTFLRMKTILCNLSLSLCIRMRVLRCYVYSTLYYGLEAWTLTDNTSKRLEAFELWCYRRMLRISYTHHVTNETVLRRMNKDKEILITVKKRKMAYFGHIMRGNKYEFLQLIMQGKINSKRGPGRRRISWLKNIRQWTGLSSTDLFRRAVNKIIWARVIANVQ